MGKLIKCKIQAADEITITLFDLIPDLCKDFIIAMALKHQLQYHLFNDDTAPASTLRILKTYQQYYN